jgi:hypothetical protein
MARGGGSGSGMMIMVILLLLLSSSALVGGYFYMNQEDTKEEVEDEFKLKYQEAARALEAERAAQQNVNVAKSALELAQEELELARLAFEGKEFANEAEKSAARARLYAAEQDVDTAAFRLSEAETDALTAASRRDTAEENANAALEIAITINTMIEANAVADANVMVTLAQGELDVAKRDWERIIGDANAAAANVIIAADAQAYAAYSAFLEAQNNFNTATTNLDTAELDLSAAKKREAAALIGAAEALAESIGAGVSVTCSANDVGEGTGAVYRVDGITNVLRHYPTAEIAASWDPNYASAQSIDCIGFALSENDMEKNPAVVAAEAFQAKVDSLGDGNPVRCDTADVGAGAGAVYRTTGTATLRHYKTAAIASSWDPDWEATTQGIDCTGFGMGADMDLEPEAAEAAAAAQSNYSYLGDGECTNDWGSQLDLCSADVNCSAIGQQSNGCWHKLKGDNATTANYNSYKPLLERKNQFALFYIGEGGSNRASANDVKVACKQDDNCVAVGRQSNNWWHKLGQSGPAHYKKPLRANYPNGMYLYNDVKDVNAPATSSSSGGGGGPFSGPDGNLGLGASNPSPSPSPSPSSYSGGDLRGGGGYDGLIY